MCKVLTIPKITDETRENALKFIKAMAPLMSEYNKDGIGYAAIDSDDALFGERWHNNGEFMRVRDLSEIDKSLVTTFGETLASNLDVSHKYNSFGDYGSGLSTIKAITLHTRMATSGKEFMNTHPFVYPEQDTSLIHNGVIRNVTAFDFKVSKCDSESILISYLQMGVNKSLDNVQAMDDKLNGYYVAGVFSRDINGRRIMDVIKGPQANLWVMYVNELKGYIFTTDSQDAFKACQALGFTTSTAVTLRAGSALRFIWGDLVATKIYSAKADAPMGYSMGKSLATTQTIGNTVKTGGTNTTTRLKFNAGKKTFTRLLSGA